MSRDTNAQNEPILVELRSQGGIQQVSLTSPDIVQKSVDALNSAMDTIQSMTRRVIVSMEGVDKSLAQMEVEFGINLTVEAGAVIAKASSECTINVRLIWESKKD